MSVPAHSVAINPMPGKGELVVLFAGHGQVKPDHKVGPQVLDYYLVHYIVSGKGKFHCLGQSFELFAGSCFFIFPGELVSYEADPEDPWHYRWIGFKGSDADRLLAACGVYATKPVVRDCGRRVPVLFSQMQRTLAAGGSGGDLAAGGRMRLLLAEWMAEEHAPERPLDEPAAEIDRQVEHAIRWLTLQYSQPVSIEEMAQTLGYHRTHLSKMFKRHTGLSPLQFLFKIRMERAKLLLQQPLTIEQIASSVGFADALYFSKQFRKWFGCSPTDYRQSLQGKPRYDCSQ